MSLITVGINHTTAPVALREVVAFTPDSTPEALRALLNRQEVEEAAILSTCNRTEVYCTVPSGDAMIPAQWLHQVHQLEAGRLNPFMYQHHEEQAVRHMLRVAAGLDSMVLGEPEVLGQLKSAYRLAQDARTLNAPLDRLFKHSFSVAKKIRTDTEIGRSAVSVAYSGVKLAQRVFDDLESLTVLLVGAGETMELTARHLMERRVRHLLVANRTLSRAAELANRFRGSALPLNELEQHLSKCDLIISSTGATEPVITRAQLASALKTRKRKPIFIIDLAVPRDVEDGASDLEDIYLYTLDDLQRITEENQSSRRAAASVAEAMVSAEVDGYMNWRRSLVAVDAIRRYRAQVADWREELMQVAERRLAGGADPRQVMEQLANTLSNRIMHLPTTRLREAAAEGREDVIDAARELFVPGESDHKSGD
ncbi:MAG: glutamyl-tRNA reductase [Pseudomonadota bacterium]